MEPTTLLESVLGVKKKFLVWVRKEFPERFITGEESSGFKKKTDDGDRFSSSYPRKKVHDQRESQERGSARVCRERE
ncbi:hypothetical protein CCACVL1_29086 [Corchorus capsularis]|uniref:Uncharacterized protein n=1 Tax=Corchorus capsularis TaxID=210143 RepID=A0A1R3G414_COCAP|nr:hypothetical protein CCACVL1_29086 [Corchorus capsularis]